MWTYHQSTGELLWQGEHVDFGYSGAGEGKNNPSMQEVHNVGPIPQGGYTIGKPEYVEISGPHGPFVLPLTPDPTNQMFGRSGFLIHGDNIHAPGTASEGCMIFQSLTRHKIWDSKDYRVQVVV